MKTAIVAGATGAIGKTLVYQLLESGDYNKVIILSRKLLTIKHAKLTQVLVEFNEGLSNKITEHVDVVYCCLGTTIKKAGSQEQFYKVDHDYVLQLAKLGKQLGASSFVMVSAMGADANSSIFYSRVKGEVEQAVQHLDYHQLIVVRPSLLIASRIEFRLGETIAKYVMKFTGFLMIGPLKKYKAIKVEQVANAMIHYQQKLGRGVHVITNDKLFL